MANSQISLPGGQLRVYAFNLHGQCMEDKMSAADPLRVDPQVIYARPPSKKDMESLVSELQKDGHRDDKIFRSDPELTEREKTAWDNPTGLELVVIVGYTLREWDDKASKKYLKKHRMHTGAGAFDAIGTKRPDNVDDIIKWDDENMPVYVVSRVKKRRPQKLQLYALILPEGGLCSMAEIPALKVFYRHEFRNSCIMPYANRLIEWGNLVLDASRTSKTRDSSVKQSTESSMGALQGAIVVSKYPEQSLSNVLEGLALRMMKEEGNDKRRAILENIKRVVEDADEDIDYRPSGQGLRAFHERTNADTREITVAEAEELIRELSSSGPNLSETNTQIIIRLHRAVRAANIYIGWGNLHYFLREAIRRMGKQPTISDAEVQDLVLDVKESSEISYAPRRPQHEAKKLGTLVIKHTSSALKELSEFIEKYEKDLLSSCGDMVVKGSIQDALAEFANASTVDTARQLAGNFFRLVRTHDASVLRTQLPYLRELAEILDSVNDEDFEEEI